MTDAAGRLLAAPYFGIERAVRLVTVGHTAQFTVMVLAVDHETKPGMSISG